MMDGDDVKRLLRQVKLRRSAVKRYGSDGLPPLSPGRSGGRKRGGRRGGLGGRGTGGRGGRGAKIPGLGGPTGRGGRRGGRPRGGRSFGRGFVKGLDEAAEALIGLTGGVDYDEVGGLAIHLMTCTP